MLCVYVYVTFNVFYLMHETFLCSSMFFNLMSSCGNSQASVKKYFGSITRNNNSLSQLIWSNALSKSLGKGHLTPWFSY